MPVTYPDAVKVARMGAVTAQAGSTAVLEICTAAYGSILVSYNLASPIAGTATGAGVLSLSGFPMTTAAAASGTAALARIRTETGGTDVVTGLTVGVSGADVTLDSVAITASQNVTINSAVLTHAA